MRAVNPRGCRAGQFLPILLFAALQWLAGGAAHAADNRNDGNTHDTREGAVLPIDEPTLGNPDDSCHSSSPVLIENREFIWSDTDVVLAGRPRIALTRYYRSFDSREGLFGKGWSTRCEKALVRVLDYVALDPEDPSSATMPRLSYVHRLANGRRYVFVESAPGEFDAPAGLPGITLSLDAEDRPTLRHLDGSAERYDEIGRLVAEVDRNGNAIEYAYTDGALSRISAADGRLLALGYDSTGHVATVTDHTERQWRYDYADDGTLESVTDPAGGVRGYRYVSIVPEASDHVYPAIEEVTDPTGTVVVGVTYTEAGKVATYSVGENLYTYSVDRGFTYKCDALDACWGYATDESGHKSEVYPPINAGQPERYEYDDDGRIVSFTDLSGTAFAQTHDALGRATSAVSTDGTASVEYVEGTSWPRRIVSPGGRETSIEHDAAGNPIRITDALGNVSTLRWSAQGDLLAFTDPLGKTASRTVDASGLTLSMTDPLGRTVSLERDRRGNVSRVTDPAGLSTTFAYDVLDRATATTDALGRTTSYEYDAAGRLIGLVDPAGATTGFAHDEFGRVVSETRPDGTTVLYAHRADNLLDSVTDPRGVVTSYRYDEGRRVTRVEAGRTRHSFAYDVLGRLTRADGGAVRVQFDYDPMGRLVTETQGRTTVEYSYDADGQLQSLSALGETTDYEYDPRGLLASMTTDAGTHRYEHDAAGRLTAHVLPGGRATTWSWDAASQLIGQDHTAVGGQLIRYSYDQSGRMEQVETGGEARSYSYDSIGRLLAVSGSMGRAYEYDAMGNRLEAGGVYDSFNRLLENDNHTFAYDEAGGLVSRLSKSDGTETRYGYDGLRRLNSIDRSSTAGGRAESTVTFGYDALGRRVTKRAEGATTEFRWAGSDLIAEFVGSSSPSVRYRYDGQYTAAEFSTLAGTYFVQTDRLGSPVAFADEIGNAWDAVPTTPYGAPLTGALGTLESTAPVLNQRFPGQYHDVETGLSYNLFRYYDPSLGRYIKDDPIGLHGGLNAYQYAGSSPTLAVDPQGLYAEFGIEIISLGLGVNAFLDCPSWTNAAFLGFDAVATAIPFIPGAASVARQGGKSLDAISAADRAAEIHRAVPDITQSKTTIAVTETREGTRIVSSSEGRLRRPQRDMLRDGEIEGTGLGHAEVTGVRAAREAGLTPTGTAASRPICHSCQDFLRGERIDPLSPLRKY